MMKHGNLNNMNNDNTINWFGKQPKQKKGKPKNKSKLNSGSVSYLGLSPKQAPQRINFFGIRKKNKQYKMTPSPLFRKESINQKHLSRYGDADMDGSPNYFDCDPKDFMKDAKPLKKSLVRRIFLEPIGKNKAVYLDNSGNASAPLSCAFSGSCWQGRCRTPLCHPG